MKYKEIELTEFKPTKNVIFDKPKKMLVWDDVSEWSEEADVVAVLPSRERPVVAVKSAWKHCAEIPEESKPRRATKQEFARWVAQGKGEWKDEYGDYAYLTWDAYCESEANEPCNEKIVVRKWDDTEWNAPTREYLGLEQK